MGTILPQETKHEAMQSVEGHSSKPVQDETRLAAFAAWEKREQMRVNEGLKRAVEERVKREQLLKQRKERLKGAFAVDDEDNDEPEAEARRFRKAAESRREVALTVPNAVLDEDVGLHAQSSAVALRHASTAVVDDDLSQKLRVVPGLSPAEAFMRLQERKRKGRRAEFGGPPRNCSPWRDGKRGITWEGREHEKRVQGALANPAMRGCHVQSW